MISHSYDIDEINVTGYEVVDRYRVDLRVRVKWHDLKNDVVLIDEFADGQLMIQKMILALMELIMIVL